MISQLDRILFDLDPIMQAPAVTTDATILRKVPSTLTTLHSSMLRTASRIPYNNPTWEMTEQQIVSMWGPLLDPVLQATFDMASWFTQYF